MVPNLEAGNILAKELTYAAQAEGAGIVLGAKVPVMLTSRADDEALAAVLLRGRRAVCALADDRRQRRHAASRSEEAAQ